MAITPLPTPVPSTSDPANFDARADALLGALPAFVTQANALEANVNAKEASASALAASAAASALTAGTAADAAVAATTLVATSATSLTLSAAAKAITLVETGRTFANTKRATLIYRGDRNIRGSGVISSAAMGAGPPTMTVTIDTFQPATGQTAHSDWLVIDEALESLAAASVADVRAGSSVSSAVTPANLMAAMAFSTLTYGATVNWDMAVDGWNVQVTFAGNPTFAAPTNLHDGLGVAMALIQGAGGNTGTWNSIFDWGADGAPTLSAGAAKVDFAFGVYKASTGKIHMTFRRAA